MLLVLIKNYFLVLKNKFYINIKFNLMVIEWNYKIHFDCESRKNTIKKTKKQIQSSLDLSVNSVVLLAPLKGQVAAAGFSSGPVNLTPASFFFSSSFFHGFQNTRTNGWMKRCQMKSSSGIRKQGTQTILQQGNL